MPPGASTGVDLPSGLNADDGSAELAVTQIRLHLAAVKTGMLLQRGPNAHV